MKKVAILGSTGSIGTLTLQVISHLGDDYRVVALSARRNLRLLKKQIEDFSPDIVCIGDEKSLDSFPPDMVKVVQGRKGLLDLAKWDYDILVNAVVGAEGLHPTLIALERGKRVCIANKETLVSFGEIVMDTAHRCGAEIIPIDSEHSAIHQCIKENERKYLDEIILTASGGPFRERDIDENITQEETLEHPTWKMGKKVTVDSATLMNKGLEVIEAIRLFEISPEKIKVVIHPQSIVHSLVRFCDGSVLAQLSIPDMRLPIQYALTYPERYPSLAGYLDLVSLDKLEFQPPDRKKFPCLSLAYRAIEIGATMPAVLSASDEVCVEAFLNKKIKLTQIPEIIGKVMKKHKPIESVNLEMLLEADRWARKETEVILCS